MGELKYHMKKHLNYLFLGIILLLVFGWSYFSYANDGIIYSIISSDISSVVEYIQSFGVLAGFVLVTITIIEVVAAPIPPLVLYVAGGIVFGTLVGGSLVLIGNVIGAVIAFLIAKKLGRNYIERKITSKQRKKFDKISAKYGALGIFFLRINPLTSSDIFSYIAGLTKMKLSSFIIGTALGLAPLIFLQTYIGSDLIKSNPLLYLGFIWISIGYFVLFLYGLWYLIRKNK